MEEFTIEIMVYTLSDDEREAEKQADNICAQIEQRDGVQSTEWVVTKS